MEGTRLEFALFLMALFALGAAEECIKTKGKACQCETPSGKVVDLSKLNGQSLSATDTKRKREYFFSPCEPVESGCPAGVAMCQKDLGTGAFYNAGNSDSLKFVGDPAVDELNLTYSATTDATRTSVITLFCFGSKRLEFESENDVSANSIYYFKLYQDITCSKSSESGLSAGSVLVIVFFVLLIVYWVGGILFMKFVRRAEGLEVIPNYEFWKELPLLIRDGISFTLRGCKGESTYEKI